MSVFLCFVNLWAMLPENKLFDLIWILTDTFFEKNFFRWFPAADGLRWEFHWFSKMALMVTWRCLGCQSRFALLLMFVLTVILTVSALTESISLTDGVILPTMEVFLVSLIVGQSCFSELFPRLLKTLAVEKVDWQLPPSILEPAVSQTRTYGRGFLLALHSPFLRPCEAVLDRLSEVELCTRRLSLCCTRCRGAWLKPAVQVK